MRIALLGVIAASLVAGAVPAAGRAPHEAPSLFVLRVDPRLCPAPARGGYWVSSANHARTQCVDRGTRPRCYVARAVDGDRRPRSAGIPDGALVRGQLAAVPYEGFGELGAIIVSEVHAPIGAFGKGTYFRVRDRGIRCVRAPCFSYTAAVVNGARTVTISTLDLARARLSPGEGERAQAAVASAARLFVLGRLTGAPDGGRALRASRVFLRAATPRA